MNRPLIIVPTRPPHVIKFISSAPVVMPVASQQIPQPPPQVQLLLQESASDAESARNLLDKSAAQVQVAQQELTKQLNVTPDVLSPEQQSLPENELGEI